MSNFEVFALVVIWGLAFVSLISGRIFAPKFSVSRKANPSLFWTAFIIHLLIAAGATSLMIHRAS